MDTPRPKLGVCWIWGSPFVWTESVDSMLQLRHPAGVDVAFFRGTGWGPAKRHLNACEKALAWGADFLLILGADQVYEPDLLERLMTRVAEGYEVIAAMVPSRGYLGWQAMQPFQRMAWRLKSHGLSPVNWSQDQLEAIDPKDGDMQRIDFVGSGVLLFRAEHLATLSQPWFYEEIDHATQTRTASMDTRFVWRLKHEVYAQIWADTTIRVRHLHAFAIDDSYSERFADWATPGVGPSDLCQFDPPSTPPTTDPAFARRDLKE
jgi:hypothetical protein